MNDGDVGALADLLDDVRRELSSAVDELERSRAAHRTLETLLLATLEHVPVPVVVVDREHRVRAASAAAERAWGAQLDAPMSTAAGLAGEPVADAVSVALDEGKIDGHAMPEGFSAALIEEPGTGDRYLVVFGDAAVG